jgi:hypothetical protein
MTISRCLEQHRLRSFAQLIGHFLRSIIPIEIPETLMQGA